MKKNFFEKKLKCFAKPAEISCEGSENNKNPANTATTQPQPLSKAAQNITEKSLEKKLKYFKKQTEISYERQSTSNILSV